MIFSVKIFQKRAHRVLIATLALFAWSLSSPANAQSDSPAAQEAACNVGNSAACTALGIRLTDGVGIAKDEKRGADLFLKACQGQARDGQGCMLWGYAMETGRGVSVNLAQAAAFYDTACELNNVYGCRNYGLLRQYGRGVVKNELYAAGAYAKSCRMGFAEGCVSEGVLQADATTLSQDRALAVQAFDRGCTLGSLDGCNKLAWHLEKGLGTNRDTARAATLYTRACQGGFQLACTNGQLLAGVSSDPSARASRPANAGNQPPPPNPGIGHMVCSAFMSEGNKLFIAWGFTAADNRYNELGQAYATMLREKRYAAASAYAPLGSPPPALTVDCRWHATEAQATDFKNRLVSGAARNRITFVPTTFNPQ